MSSACFGCDGDAGDRGCCVKGCASFLGAFSLCWVVPGFGRLTLATALLWAGTVLPTMTVIPVLQKRTWGHHSVAYASYAAAGSSCLGLLFSAQFGRWSDMHRRRSAAIITAVLTMLPPLALLITGITPFGCWTWVCLQVISGPFRITNTGSAVLWAYYSDVLPPHTREAGFSIITIVGSATIFATTLLSRRLADAIEDSDRFFLWVSASMLIAVLLVFATMPSRHSLSSEPRQEDNVVTAGAPLSCVSSLKMVTRLPALRALCIVAGLVTLPDMAYSGVASQVLFEMLHLEDADVQNQLKATDYYFTYSMPVQWPVILILGILAGSFGQSKVLSVWIPAASVLFVGAALPQFFPDAWAVWLAGSLAVLPNASFPLLHALVSHVVPSSEVGEAMGCVTAVKNLGSFVGPLATAAVTDVVAGIDGNDFLWLIFPICGVLMLGATPWTLWLVRHEGPHDSGEATSSLVDDIREWSVNSCVNAD